MLVFAEALPTTTPDEEVATDPSERVVRTVLERKGRDDQQGEGGRGGGARSALCSSFLKRKEEEDSHVGDGLTVGDDSC